MIRYDFLRQRVYVCFFFPLKDHCQIPYSIHLSIFIFIVFPLTLSIHLFICVNPFFLNFNFYLWTDLNKLSSSTPCLSLSWMKTLLMAGELKREDDDPLNSFSADWTGATQLVGGVSDQ